MHAPRECDWQLCKRFIELPQGPQDDGWAMTSTQSHAKPDTDWAGYKETRNTTSCGIIVYLVWPATLDQFRRFPERPVGTASRRTSHLQRACSPLPSHGLGDKGKKAMKSFRGLRLRRRCPSLALNVLVRASLMQFSLPMFHNASM